MRRLSIVMASVSALCSVAACAAVETPKTAEVAELAITVPTCSQRLSGPVERFTLDVETADNRTVLITLFVPKRTGAFPLIAFSHGAFSSPDRYRAMLEPLAGAGAIIVAPMHIDSEEYPRGEGDPEQPPHPITWTTRNADFALALNPPSEVRALLAKKGLKLDDERVFALGHSYGALIAQLAGGAMAIEPDGSQVSRRNSAVDAVIAWSPPGPMPGFMAEEGWTSLSVPSLTITGTADILPGFIDDWRVHKASYEYAPIGQRALWVGDGIDHYFGGVFGRVKEQPGDVNDALFRRALATSLRFMDVFKSTLPCALEPPIAGEMYEEDQQ